MCSSILSWNTSYERVLEAIPAFVQNGLVAAAGFIPALGIALLAQMILSKKNNGIFYSWICISCL